MGRIEIILKKKQIPKPELNRRLTVELCENVHIHYRNLRLEFTKDEFLYILTMLKSIDENDVNLFHFSPYAYKELIKDFNLPDETYYDNRLQIELQKEGHCHIHYRNLRIELNSLSEIGFGKFFSARRKLKNYIKKIFLLTKNEFIRKICKIKPAECILKNKTILIDENWANKNIIGRSLHTYKVTKIKLKNLLCVLFVKEGIHSFRLEESPVYKYINGDKQCYVDYCNFKNPIGGGDIHSTERLDDLVDSLNDKYNTNSVIIVNDKNEILDGMHRACWLLSKYGKNYKVNVLKLWYAA